MADYRIIEGDALERLREMEAGSVQTCVTSPPYWQQRDYGAAGQLGLEATPEEYVANLVAALREVRRVLRDDGTLWLNLGDSYAANRSYQVSQTRNPNHDFGVSNATTVPPGLKPKDLVGIPWLTAFALRADGWYLRSDIIWAKPNPMPESVTDRPTKAHEYLFLLSKSPRYYWDAEAIREEAQDWGERDRMGPLYDGSVGPQNGHTGLRDLNHAATGRNRRSVWTVTTQPFPGAHFATFPPKLIEPCILAGAPEKCCGECGAPQERIVERKPMVVTPTPKREAWQAADDHARTQIGGTMTEPPSSETIGWRSTCEHDGDDSATPLVLDPFAGAGTTGLVALRHNRSFVGIELNPTYAQMARNRIHDDAPLLNLEAA